MATAKRNSPTSNGIVTVEEVCTRQGGVEQCLSIVDQGFALLVRRHVRELQDPQRQQIAAGGLGDIGGIDSKGAIRSGLAIGTTTLNRAERLRSSRTGDSSRPGDRTRGIELGGR